MYYTRACILSDGDTVLWGRSSQSSEPKFHFYGKDDTAPRQTINKLCQHNLQIHLLSIIIGHCEYLAVSCEECNNIQLINLQQLSDEPIMAYSGERGNVGPMCHSQRGILYTVGMYRGEVLVMDCSRTNFICKFIWFFQINTNSICYIDSIDSIVLCSSMDNRICAISSSGKIEWDISEIDSIKCTPSSLVYLPEQDFLMVKDISNRISCLFTTTGKWLQHIHLNVGDIKNLHVADNKLVVRYSSSSTGEMISYYRVSVTIKVFSYILKLKSSFFTASL